MPECEGNCVVLAGGHGDEVRHVHVFSPLGYDWGVWWYCEEAVAEDRRRGFTVTEETSDADAS